MFFESGALYSVMGIIYLATLLSTKIDMFLLPFEQSAVSLCRSFFLQKFV
jgi:hypothetical protein